MLAYLADALPESDDFDREEAIYWYACSWHGGQWSNLYSALSTSESSPGIISSAPEPGSMGEMCLEELETHWPEG
jgi:hypothetical protein